MFKQLLSGIILSCAIAPFTPAAFANNLLTLQQGNGTSFALLPGTGTNISFIETGETIQQIWIDDPSWISLDANGCVALATSGGDCQGATPARVLHLRRIDQLDMPGLPTTTETELTIITQTPQGGELLYAFTVTQQGDRYSIINIIPTPTPVQRRVAEVDLTAVRLGRDAAVTQGTIDLNDPLYQRISHFLDLAEYQDNPESAAQDAGISLDLVMQLEEIGIASLPSDRPDPNQMADALQQLHNLLSEDTGNAGQ